MLIVLNPLPAKAMLCRCTLCGEDCFRRRTDIRRGIKSCGCATRGRKAINLTGKKFGRLVVIGRSIVKSHPTTNRAMWECRCVCGNATTVQSQCLRDGVTRSCGCLRNEALMAGRSNNGLPIRTQRASNGRFEALPIGE